MAPRSSRPRTSGFGSVPRSRARTCALPCASDTASGATNASSRALTSPSTSAWMFSGTKPGPSVARPAEAHRRAVDGDGQVLDGDAALRRARSVPEPIDDVAVEVLRAQADGRWRWSPRRAGPACPACRRALSSTFRSPAAARAGWRRPGTAAAAPGPGARTACPTIALPSSRPATTRSPPSVLKCASSSMTRSPLHADVQRARRLDAHALDGRLAVRALDGARHRQPQLGQQHVQRQRPRRIDVDRDAPADDAARVAERDQLGRERLDLHVAEVELGVHGGPFGRQRRLGVDVEAVEQPAVDGDAGDAARADGRRATARGARRPSLTPRTIDLRQVDVAGQLGAIRAAADVQLRAGEAADRDVRRRPRRAGPSAAACRARRRDRDPGARARPCR